MTTLTRTGLRAALVALVISSWWTSASAQSTLTPAGTSIQNRATVNYSVGGQAQALIESSPTGNTTPGANAGASTTFVVDNRVDLTVAELGATATPTTPGAVNALLTYTVTNTGNAPQGYALTLAEQVTGTTFPGGNDNADFTLANLVVRVDDGDNTFDAGDVAPAINTLNPGQTVTVFVVAPVVTLTLVNGNRTNIRLQAQTAVSGTNGGTPQLQSGGVNDPTVVEVVFADIGVDATESAVDQFFIQSASLTIQKTQTVISDGFSASNPRSIPGATVEYQIEIENTSPTIAADLVSISDPVPTNTTFLATQAVLITNGVVATCTGDANDGDSDGCGVTAGALTIGTGVIGSVTPGEIVTVAFQVTIN
jgi:uncharacterized repeat protein (TIGR01451 family)